MEEERPVARIQCSKLDTALTQQPGCDTQRSFANHYSAHGSCCDRVFLVAAGKIVVTAHVGLCSYKRKTGGSEAEPDE